MQPDDGKIQVDILTCHGVSITHELFQIAEVSFHVAKLSADCAAYYYFKFVRGKKQKDEDLDFFDDEGYEEEPYINEDEEPVIADDEDNGDETKETEETI